MGRTGLELEFGLLEEFAISTGPTGMVGGSGQFGGGGEASQQWCHRLGCGEQPVGRIGDRGQGQQMDQGKQ